MDGIFTQRSQPDTIRQRMALVVMGVEASIPAPHVDKSHALA